MKTARHCLMKLVFCLLAVNVVCPAADVRPAVDNGLRFLTRAGDEWMAEKNCMGCHHMPILIWSQSEARKRGLNVDQVKLDEWIDWSLLKLDGKSKQGVEAMSQLMLALPSAAPQLRQRILAEQQKDGSWKPGGQFASMQQRSTPEAQEATTRLALIALMAGDEESSARERALISLPPSTVADSTETLVWRLLLSRGQGSSAVLDELLKRQHADGGWAWRTGEPVSDALATGQVSYALHTFPTAKAAASKGRQWLVSNQSADGSWKVDVKLITKVARKDFTNVNGIYQFWASGWATLALLQEMPMPGIVPAVAER